MPDQPLSIWNFPKPVKDKKLKQPTMHLFNPQSMDEDISDCPAQDSPISKPKPLTKECPDTPPSIPSADSGFNPQTTCFA